MVILTQTDTTVGFVSQNEQQLTEIKERVSTKPFIKIYKDFKTLLTCRNRVPSKFKNTIRRSSKTTFIVDGKAFRVAKSSVNSQPIRDIDWHFSTSANEIGKNYDREFCEQKSDIICETKDGLEENNSSSLYKINKSKRIKLR